MSEAADLAHEHDLLAGLLRTAVDDWSLRADGEPRHGAHSIVLPVRTDDAVRAVLKVAVPTSENEHEALALQHWGGQAAVRLLRADPRRRLLLLERLGPSDLTDAWDLEACRAVGALYRRLHRPAPPQLTPLSEHVRRWREELAALPRDAGLPPRLVEQAVSIARTLQSDPATDGTLVHTDLHYGTVLAREDRWAAVAPRPVSGDPHCEPAPMLWHRWQEVADDHAALRWTMRERFTSLVDAGGLDEDRARAWAVLRLVVHGLAAARGGDRQELTAVVRIVKALDES